MHVHILGICGTFMGGIAQIAKQMGIEVSGCDANVYPPMSEQLISAGINLYEGYGVEQLDDSVDVYIIGNAITRGNPLLEAILNRGLAYTSGPQWLSENVLRHKHVLAVAGTHGKTTTTSMLTWILQYSGLNPGYLVGGVPQNFGTSARLTDSKFFVIEADEYDTAFFDKRSKFVHYRPRTAILNNLEYDHADIFPDVASIQKQFHHLVRTIPSHGKVIYNHESQTLKEVLKMGVWTPCESFGLEKGSDWLVEQMEPHRVFCGTQELGVLFISMAGAHNQLNALAAIAAASDIGIPVEKSLDALKNFCGVKRRMELKGEARGVKVIDDFAHHPTAIHETIKAVRAAYPNSRILAVLEPRSNTMKLGSMKQLLAGSLEQADKVFCYKGPSVAWDVSKALETIAHKTLVFTSIDPLVRACTKESHAGDVILVMSNGGFGGIHKKLLDTLGQRTGQ